MKSSLKIVYFGTPLFSADILRYLLQKGVDVVAVVTQPDRPKGRSGQNTPSPVKEVVLRECPHVFVLTPEKASEPGFLEQLALLKGDLYVVVAFGQILPQKLLDIPPLGCINVHTSLLPHYRGAAPIQRALFNGDKKTGVSIQKMVKQLDAGDVICVSEVDIPEEMTFGKLQSELCEVAKHLLHSVLGQYEKGIPAASPQDPLLVTYAPKIEPEDGLIDWNKSARELHNQVRAFSPRPGAWAWIETGGETKRLKILRTHIHPSQGTPGTFSPEGWVFALEQALELLEVQPEGKKLMSGADWLRGCRGVVKFSTK